MMYVGCTRSSRLEKFTWSSQRRNERTSYWRDFQPRNNRRRRYVIGVTSEKVEQQICDIFVKMTLAWKISYREEVCVEKSKLENAWSALLPVCANFQNEQGVMSRTRATRISARGFAFHSHLPLATSATRHFEDIFLSSFLHSL